MEVGRMNFVKCFCGSTDFIRVISIPKTKPPIKVREKKIICNKCKREYEAKAVNEVLSKV